MTVWDIREMGPIATLNTKRQEKNKKQEDSERR
jgi:hypothetical protein